jgi:hypothetical protein
MDQIHGAESSAFLLRCCVRAKTNQLNGIKVEHIIEHEVILWPELSSIDFPLPA